MPGFMIDQTGVNDDELNPASAYDEYYYSYTWTILNLFKDPTDPGSLRHTAAIHLKDCTLPTFTVNQERYQGASLEYKFAKSVSWDDIKVSWYDTKGLVDIIRKWRQNIWTSEKGIKTAYQYKKETMILNYLPTGQGKVKWKLINSWPSSIRYGDLTYTTSDAKFVDINITYDWAEDESQQDDSQ